ncbi:hypothetical protein D917_10665, partial [Trichinella nativa]
CCEIQVRDAFNKETTIRQRNRIVQWWSVIRRSVKQNFPHLSQSTKTASAKQSAYLFHRCCGRIVGNYNEHSEAADEPTANIVNDRGHVEDS